MPLKTSRSPLAAPCATPESSFAVGSACAAPASTAAAARPALNAWIVFNLSPHPIGRSAANRRLAVPPLDRKRLHRRPQRQQLGEQLPVERLDQVGDPVR